MTLGEGVVTLTALPKEDCFLGASNAIRIKNLEEDIRDMKDCIKDIKKEMATSKNLSITILIGVLVQLFLRFSGIG